MIQPGLRAVPAVAALMLLVQGCAGAPPLREPSLDLNPPQAYGVAADVSVGETEAWWTLFADPRLDSLIARAYRRNHDFQAAAYRMDEVLALSRVAGADLAPALSGGADASRAKQNFIGLPIPGNEGGVLSTTNNSFGTSLQLSWELDLWGRIRSGKSAAVADAQAAWAEYHGARLSLAGQVAKTWFDVIEAREQTRLAEETVASYEVTVEQTRDRFQRGVTTSLDLRLAMSQLAQAEGRLETRRRVLNAGQRRLEVLAGDYPSGALDPGDALPRPADAVPGGIPAELIARRPDLAAAERRLAASGARVSQARAALYPRISLTASAGTSSNELKDLVDFDFSVWRLAGNLTAPLFQGGRLRGQLTAAQAREHQAVESFAGIALRAYAEVEQALASEAMFRREVERYDTAAQEAQAAQRVAEEQYRGGLVEFITVLESQRRSLAARSAAITTRRAQLDNRVDLHLALGGGFVVPDPKRTPQPVTAGADPEE